MKNIFYVLVCILFITACSTKKEIIIEEKQVAVKPDTKKLDEQKKLQNELADEILKADEEISFIDDNQELVKEEEFLFNKEEKVDIAIIFPSKLIGKYAKSSINTITGYFLYKNVNFKIKVFDSIDEDPLNVAQTVEVLKRSGIKKVIALYTKNGFNVVNSFNNIKDLKVYFPLIHKDELLEANENFIFGGISYKDQMSKLMELSNFDNHMYYQNTFLGRKLKKYYDELTVSYDVLLDDEIIVNKVESQEIKQKNNNFRVLLEKFELDEKTIFLNTSIVKTSILLSQFTIYNKEPFVVLSTQLNYNPLLISLTQSEDRKKFFVANSIGDIDPVLADTISTLGANVIYNWVDYSTLVGVNYLFDLNSSGLIPSKISLKQVQYEPRLYVSTSFGFLEIK
jgi:hypothetical protein